MLHFLSWPLLLCLPILTAWAEPALGSGSLDEPLSIFDQMYRGEGVLDITLETDITQLIADKTSETYYPAFLSFQDPQQEAITYPVNVRMRGRYRRRVCDFPPLKFKFPEEFLVASGFNPRYRSLKLVTHCLEDERASEENVLLEYLTYKMFSELTDHSFRVQLVRVTYIDRQDSTHQAERYGFLIEDPDQVADRIGGTECEEQCMNPEPDSLDAKQTTLVALYQYMVGNADWGITLMRNLKLIRKPEGSGYEIVPYDFDFAGMINADYAVPNRDYDQSTLRERVYLGLPVDDAVLRWGLNYFKFKREDMLDEVQNFDLLSRKVRRDALRYLDSFFEYVDKLKVNSATDLYEKLSAVKLAYPLPDPLPVDGP